MFFVINAATAQPKKVSDQFLNQCLSGKASEAYSSTEYSFKSANTEDEFIKYCSSLSKIISSKPATYYKYIEKGDDSTQSVMLYRAKYYKGGEIYIKTDLQKGSDSWHVNQVAVSKVKYSSIEQN
jgi:hypothetical protein